MSFVVIPFVLMHLGYRNPFVFIGVKGGALGSAMFCLDKHAQSKTMLRAEATVTVRKLQQKEVAAKQKGKHAKGKGKTAEKKGGLCVACVELVDCRSSRTLVTEKIETIDKGSTAPCTEGGPSGRGRGAKKARLA
jgi:hypothetical protein